MDKYDEFHEEIKVLFEYGVTYRTIRLTLRDRTEYVDFPSIQQYVRRQEWYVPRRDIMSPEAHCRRHGLDIPADVPYPSGDDSWVRYYRDRDRGRGGGADPAQDSADENDDER